MEEPGRRTVKLKGKTGAPGRVTSHTNIAQALSPWGDFVSPLLSGPIRRGEGRQKHSAKNMEYKIISKLDPNAVAARGMYSLEKAKEYAETAGRNWEDKSHALLGFEAVEANATPPPLLHERGDGTWMQCYAESVFKALKTMGFAPATRAIRSQTTGEIYSTIPAMEANVMSGVPAKAVAAGLVRFPA